VLEALAEELRHNGLHVLTRLQEAEAGATVGTEASPGLDEHVFVPQRALMADAVESPPVLVRVDADQTQRRWEGT